MSGERSSQVARGRVPDLLALNCRLPVYSTNRCPAILIRLRQVVGWVERSEPHRVDEQAMVGLAPLDPPYTPLFSVLAGMRPERRAVPLRPAFCFQLSTLSGQFLPWKSAARCGIFTGVLLCAFALSQFNRHSTDVARSSIDARARFAKVSVTVCGKHPAGRWGKRCPIPFLGRPY